MKKRRVSNLIFLMIVLTAVLLFSSGIRLFFMNDIAGTTVYFLMGIVLFLGILEWFRSTHTDGS